MTVQQGHPEVSALAPDAAGLRAAVATAVRAPSVHNTQPWLFTVGAGALDVHADRSRQLGVLDPHGRALAVSCGAAVAGARLALHAQGWETAVDRCPTDDPDHLARVRVTGPRTPTRDDGALLRAAHRRQSTRGPLHGDRVLAPHVADLLAEVPGVAGGGGAAAVALGPAHGDPALRRDVLVLQARADAALEADPAYREELARWVRTRDADDGVAPGAGATPGPPRRPSDWAQRRFADGPTTGPPSSGGHDDPVVLVLSAPDDAAGWLAAGEALGRVLVRAESLGLAAVAMTQVVEVPAERERLRRLLGLAGQPQVLVRVGHPVRPGIARPTPRRPLDEVLRPAGAHGETAPRTPADGPPR